MIRRSPSARAAAAAFLFAAPWIARASVYHVDERHPDACDSNPGTREAPLRHIGEAAKRVAPGDTVTIHEGTYREMIFVPTPGEPDRPIVFQAAPDETVVVKGSVVVEGWEPYSARPAGLEGEYPRENLWIRRGWTREFVYAEDTPDLRSPQRDRLLISPRWAFWKDAPMEGAGWLTFAFTRDELQEERMFHDEDAEALIIWLPPGIDPNEDGIEVCVRPHLMTGNMAHLVIRGIQWRHANTRNFANWSALTLRGESVFEDNLVSWNDYIGFSANGTNNVVRRNVFAFNGASGLGGRGYRHLFEDNQVLFNNIDRHDTFNDSGGGKFVRLTHSVFRRHVAAYNFGPGLWFDISVNDNLVESSLFHHNHGAGLFIEISHDNVVRNNIFAYNTEMPGGMRIKWEPHGDAPTQARTRHYVERGDLGWGAYNSSSAGTVWINNLFYANQNAGLVAEGGWRRDGSIPLEHGPGPVDGDETGWTTTKNLTILNNLFVGNGGPQLMIRSPGRDEDCTGNVSDYNLFDIPVWTGARIGSESFGGPNHRDLASWQEATGWDRHSLVANSELELPAAGFRHPALFRPSLISPAADRGTPHPLATHDFFGNPRPVGQGVDIGPFERFSMLAARPETGVPAGLTFHPVSLDGLLNRALADEVADDGVGGWSDQGPECDLRQFARVLPTDNEGRPIGGVVRLADVNFRLEYPQSILVLNPGGFRPGDLPEEAVIPVGRRADWLFFLHGTAWGGNWDYLVRYADGGEERIEVRTSENMRDWSAGSDAPFRFEQGTHSTVAWVGRNPTFSHVALYRMAWGNPRPGEEITEIHMIGLRGVPGLFGLTLGMP